MHRRRAGHTTASGGHFATLSYFRWSGVIDPSIQCVSGVPNCSNGNRFSVVCRRGPSQYSSMYVGRIALITRLAFAALTCPRSLQVRQRRRRSWRQSGVSHQCRMGRVLLHDYQHGLAWQPRRVCRPVPGQMMMPDVHTRARARGLDGRAHCVSKCNPDVGRHTEPMGYSSCSGKAVPGYARDSGAPTGCAGPCFARAALRSAHASAAFVSDPAAYIHSGPGADGVPLTNPRLLAGRRRCSYECGSAFPLAGRRSAGGSANYNLVLYVTGSSFYIALASSDMYPHH